MPRAYYFGKLEPNNNGAGHNLYTQAGTLSPTPLAPAVGMMLPRWLWLDAIDGRLTPTTRREQGACSLILRDGWTVLAWHDYTGDRRPGSNSVMIFEGSLTFADALEAARLRFPAVMQRQPEPFLV